MGPSEMAVEIDDDAEKPSLDTDNVQDQANIDYRRLTFYLLPHKQSELVCRQPISRISQSTKIPIASDLQIRLTTHFPCPDLTTPSGPDKHASIT